MSWLMTLISAREFSQMGEIFTIILEVKLFMLKILQRIFSRLAGPIDDWLSPMCNPLFSLAGRRPLVVHCSSSYSLYVLLLYWNLLQLRASLQQRPNFTSLLISQFKKPELQFDEYLECSTNASFHIMAVSLRCNSL